MTEEDKETERTMFLQRVLLDYLAVNGGETDQAMMNARHFYIGQWYRDANVIGKATKGKCFSEDDTKNNHYSMCQKSDFGCTGSLSHSSEKIGFWST